MMGLPTTDAMVQAAQDAYDVAAAEVAVLTARATEIIREAGPVKSWGWKGVGSEIDEALAKVQVAIAAREYAWSVLVSVRADRQAVPA